MRHRLIKAAAGAVAFVLAATAIFSVTCLAMPADSDTIYQGIDVSIYQGDIDFEAVKDSGIQAVYIRAGEGDNVTDANFEKNTRGAKGAGLVFGYYYYVTATTRAQAVSQAKYFAGLIKGTGYTARPAMDFEEFDGLSRGDINIIGLAFMQTLESESGVRPMLYSDADDASAVWTAQFSKYPLWVADYSGGDLPPDSTVWSSFAGYQYADDGKIDGISGDVDLDKFTDRVLLTDSEKPSDGSGGGDSGSSDTSTGEKRIVYHIKWGDTLWALSRRFGVNIPSIAKDNSIINPNLIFAGRNLFIRVVAKDGYYTYTVAWGDTLSAVSRWYGVSVDDLVKTNDIANRDLIYPAQKIKIAD